MFVSFQGVFVNSVKKIIVESVLYKNKMFYRIEKSSQNDFHKSCDNVPEK